MAMEELTKYMRALVYLQVEAMAEGRAFRKPELLLTQAGFSYTETASILNKSPNAVKMAVHRSKKASGQEDLNGVD